MAGGSQESRKDTGFRDYRKEKKDGVRFYDSQFCVYTADFSA